MSFVEAFPDALALVDGQGRIALVNRAMEQMFGFERDELYGQSIDFLVPERLHAHRQGEPQTAEGEWADLWGRRKDGIEFPVEASCSPLTSEGRTLFIRVFRDTTRRKAEAKFRGLLESAPDGIVVVDGMGRIAIVNTQTERMFGYSRDELVGRPIEILVPARFRGAHLADRKRYFDEPKTRPMGAGQALTGLKRDGTEFPVEISLSPLETDSGVLITSIIRDITQRRRAEEQVKASLREKEVLLKEIHHRVKNNLQVTSSLLRLQSSALQDPEARGMFTESQLRIRSMALVHEKLYQSTDLSRIDFADYARTLSKLLVRTYGGPTDRVSLTVRAEPLFLSIEAAVPCGLILNELVSNCLKHAFPDTRAGKVEVQVHRRESDCELAVSDDGVGLPEQLDVRRAESLGLQLVSMLVGQLQGALEVERAGGTTFRVRFAEGRP